MATLTIKGLPDEIYAMLRQRADAEHRSINSQVIVCLERELFSRHVDADEILASADTIRSRLRVPRLTDEILRKAKRAGRA